MRTDNQIGNRIKERRKELNITQPQIQEKAGISSGHLSCIENGRYLPSAQALIALSEILDCSIDWILKGEATISKIDGHMQEKERILVDGYRKLPASERDELMEILEMKLRKVNGDT